jgi:hypothetical protein
MACIAQLIQTLRYITSKLGEFVELGKFWKGNILVSLVSYEDMRSGFQRRTVASEQDTKEC